MRMRVKQSGIRINIARHIKTDEELEFENIGTRRGLIQMCSRDIAIFYAIPLPFLSSHIQRKAVPV